MCNIRIFISRSANYGIGGLCVEVIAKDSLRQGKFAQILYSSHTSDVPRELSLDMARALDLDYFLFNFGPLSDMYDWNPYIKHTLHYLIWYPATAFSSHPLRLSFSYKLILAIERET